MPRGRQRGRDTGRALSLILLLLGCGASQAELYTRALGEEDFDRALELCASLEALAGDCTIAAVQRMGRWDACDRLPDSGECHFLNADRIGLAGDVGAGLRECRLARPYADECNAHLVGLLAMRGDTLAEAEANFATVEPDLVMRRGRPQFLRLWFRHRVESGLPASADDCLDPVCRNAANHEIKARAAADRHGL